MKEQHYSPLEISIAKIAYSNPLLYCQKGFYNNARLVLKNIFPLLKYYYVFKYTENKEIFIDTIFNEISDMELPNKFFEKIKKDRLIAVFKPKNTYIEKGTRLEFTTEQKKSNDGNIGEYVFKGFEKDLDLDLTDLRIVRVKQETKILIDPLLIDYLEEHLPKIEGKMRELIKQILLKTNLFYSYSFAAASNEMLRQHPGFYPKTILNKKFETFKQCYIQT